MKIFARPNKAFREYEARMARQPVTWPPTTHALPDLWYRARELFRHTLDTIGSALRLAWRQTLTRTERSELLIRLVPVEKIIRTLLVVEALTFLLMTPEGAKMRREAKPVAIPAPPGPVAKPQPMTERDRFRAMAMQSIAAHHPRIDPRVVEREERQRREALEARKAAFYEENPFSDPLRRSPFRVFGWMHEAGLPPEYTPKRRVWAEILDAPDMLAPIHTQRPRAPETEDDDGWLETGPGLTIARRIAALQRVLDDPMPVIRRLARQLASMPREAFPEPAVNRFRAAEWWHGRPEYYNATSHAACAHRAYMRTEPKLEPG
jgi:hypothetical protein